jgi:hypothetical protein
MQKPVKITRHNHSRSRNWVLAPVLVAAALVLPVASAQASVAYGETGSFGGDSASEFSRPTGVAVDQSNGDVYVVDAGNARVQKLGPKGEFILMFGQGVNENSTNVCGAGEKCKAGVAGTGEGQFGVDVPCLPGCFPEAVPTGVAVDPESHDVYVADSVNQRVEEFTAAGKWVNSITAGFSPQALAYGETGVDGVAVDPVEDKVKGGHDLYVTDYGNNVVDVFSSTGALLTHLTVEAPDGVAFDSSGNAYVIARGEKAIYKFANGEGAGVKLSLEGNIELAEAITVDSAGDLLVAEHNSFGGSLKVLDFAPSGTRLAEFGEGSSGFESYGDPTGVAVDLATATAYFSGGAWATGSFDKVWSFERQVGEPPTAETGAAKEETATTAKLTGMVNPGGPTSEFWFKYGLTEGYGSETTHASAGSGTSPREVAARAEGLQPHVTYHYRLFAHNAFGTTEATEAKELTTLSEAPLVSGEQAVGITQTAATLEAQVNPNNEEAHYHIEYSSTSSSLSSGVTTVPALPGGVIVAGYGNVPISQPLSPLAANTTYYWRAVASNTGGGTRQGTIESFLTRPVTPTTEAASHVSDGEATLNGSFNPGNQATRYYFEYGTAACTPSSCGTKTSIEGPVSGTSEVRPTAVVATLSPLTTYHYRIVVENAGGPSYGLEKEETTLPQAPAVLTGPPVSVTTVSAILAGEVVPQCVEGRYPPTTYRFQYGTTTAYAAGSEEAAIAASSCATGGEAVTASLAGLSPSTVYHYRVVAKNSGGETQGDDRTFTTNASGGPSANLPPGFSLTGPPLAGPAPFVFPDLAGLSPPPPPPVKTTTTPKPLTNAQKLSKALKACKKDKSKAKRAKCQKEARKKYGKTTTRKK